MLRPIIGVLGYVLHPERDRVLMVLRSRDGDQHQAECRGDAEISVHLAQCAHTVENDNITGCVHQQVDAGKFDAEKDEKEPENDQQNSGFTHGYPPISRINDPSESPQTRRILSLCSSG